MTVQNVDPRIDVPQDTLFVWMLVDPAHPMLVGEVRLSQLEVNRAIFSYAPTWWNFPLSEDLPLIASQDFTAHESGSAPGALDDARPDRWGERLIRAIEPPARLSILEMLLFAGDQRFGALGISVSADRYTPRQVGPLPHLNDLAALTQAVEDVQTQTPLQPTLQRLVQPGTSLGGARPKALIHTDKGPCVIKFSELGDTVDTPLIEHATMTLAATCGIQIATTGVLTLPERHGKKRHVLTIERFDRLGDYRLHCLSANTVLRAANLPQSYSALATVLLRLAHPDRQVAQREELFKRMVFNLLMDNTDDHERNHALRLGFDGYYALTPAYDVVPSLQNIGYQAMAVGAQGAESTLDNALSHLNEFGIKRPRALALVAEVVQAVNHWQAHFIQMGVCPADMAQLTAHIDRDALKQQRLAY